LYTTTIESNEPQELCLFI